MAVPLVLIGALVAVTSVWSWYAGFSWTPGLEISSVFLLMFLGMHFALLYFPGMPAPSVPRKRVAEACLYLFLGSILAIFGVRFSYLFQSLGFPFQDHALRQMDLVLGFDWLSVHRFFEAHGELRPALRFAYDSFSWQWPLSIVILCAIGQGTRTLKLLTAFTIAIILTIPIAGLFPALAANEAYGIPSTWRETVLALRAGDRAFTGYLGLLTFPSLHTTMALVYPYYHRGLKWSFPLFIVLNTGMLISIPVMGFHYLTDMLGGAMVAAAAIYLADKALTRQANARLVTCRRAASPS